MHILLLLLLTISFAFAYKPFDVEVKEFSLSKKHVKIGEAFNVNIKVQFKNIQSDVELGGIFLDKTKVSYYTGYVNTNFDYVEDLNSAYNQLDMYSYNIKESIAYYANIGFKVLPRRDYSCDPPEFRIPGYIYKSTNDRYIRHVGFVTNVGPTWLLQTIDALSPKVDLYLLRVDNGSIINRDKNIVYVNPIAKVHGIIYIQNESRYYGPYKWVYGSGYLKIRIYSQEGRVREKTIQVYVGEDENTHVEFTLDGVQVGVDKILIEIIPDNNLYCYDVDDEDVNETNPLPPPAPDLQIDVNLYQKSDLHNSYTKNNINALNYVEYKIEIKNNNKLKSLSLDDYLCKTPYEIVDLQYPSYLHCYVRHDGQYNYVYCQNVRDIPENTTLVITYKVKLN